MNGLGNLISPTGRALQSQMDKMSPEQFDQTAQQYIASGMLSFGDLMTIKAQYDHLKQQGQNGPASPPQSTVAQDMQNEIAQGQGVASLPTQIGSPQAYAGGGIVAFAGGGSSTFVDEFGDMWERDADGSVRRVSGHLYDNPQEVGPKQNFRSRVRTTLQKPRSAKELAGKVGRGVKGAYLPAVGITAGLEGLDALTGNAVPTENMYEYYGIDPYADTELGQVAKDVGVRTLGEIHRVGTLGFFGPQKDGKQPAEADVADADADAADTDIDPARFMGDDSMSGLAALYGGMGSPNVGNYLGELKGLTARDAADAKAEMAGGEEAMIAKREKQKRDMGVYEPIEMGKEKLTKRGEKIDKDEKRVGTDALASFFFQMAANAAKPGATALGAAAEAAPEGFAEYKRLKKDIADSREKLDNAEFALRQEEAKLKAGSIDAGSEDYRQARQRYDAARGRHQQVLLVEAEAKFKADLQTMENQFRIKLASITEADKLGPKRQIEQAYVNSQMSKDLTPQEKLAYGKKYMEMLGELTKANYGPVFKPPAGGGLAENINELREQERQRNGGGGEGWSITPIE